MGLVLTGKLFSRNSKPYSMKDRETGDVIEGTSHKVRVTPGRGEFLDVKVSPEQFKEQGGFIPPTSEIPEDGLDIAWDVTVSFGKVVCVGEAPAAAGTRALRPAASS